MYSNHPINKIIHIVLPSPIPCLTPPQFYPLFLVIRRVLICGDEIMKLGISDDEKGWDKFWSIFFCHFCFLGTLERLLWRVLCDTVFLFLRAHLKSFFETFCFPDIFLILLGTTLGLVSKSKFHGLITCL